jgi:hypothetical protein
MGSPNLGQELAKYCTWVWCQGGPDPNLGPKDQERDNKKYQVDHSKVRAVAFAGDYWEYTCTGNLWWKKCDWEPIDRKENVWISERNDDFIKVKSVWGLWGLDSNLKDGRTTCGSKGYVDEEARHGPMIKSFQVFNHNILSRLKQRGQVKQWQDFRNQSLSPIRTRSNYCPGYDDVPVLDESLKRQKRDSTTPELVAMYGQSMQPGQIITHAVPVDQVEAVTFKAYVQEGIEFAIQSPDGTRIDLTNLISGVTYISSTNKIAYVVEKPLTGTWQLEFIASNTITETGYNLVTFVDGSHVKFSTAEDMGTYRQSDNVVITATLLDDGKPFVNGQIEATVRKPDGVTITLTLYDDGINQDDVAGDGTYTTEFTSKDLEGYYDIVLSAQGTSQVNGQFARLADAGFAIVISKSAFGSNHVTTPNDTDGDNLFDTLTVEVEIVTDQEDLYSVSGALVDQNGVEIQRVTDDIQLAPGNHKVPLVFNGQLIFENRQDGPLTLKDVTLDKGELSVTVTETDNLYTTPSYNFMQFQHEPIVLSDNETTDKGVDTDGDGLHDYLQISLTIHAFEAGEYNISGRLALTTGETVYWFDQVETLDNQTIISLWVDGTDILSSNQDGPYYLRDLVIRKTDDTVMASYSDVYETQPYQFTQFGETNDEGVFTATLTIVNGTPGQTVDFNGDLGEFTLADNESLTFSDIVPGYYSVSQKPESFPTPHWTLLTVTCQDQDGQTMSIDLTETRDDFKAIIPLNPSEHLTCTFLNEKANLDDNTD